MGKVKSISPTKTARIVSLFNDSKMPKKEIAQLLEVSPSTVRYTIKTYKDSRGSSASFRDAPRTGRPSKFQASHIHFGDKWLLYSHSTMESGILESLFKSDFS